MDTQHTTSSSSSWNQLSATMIDKTIDNKYQLLEELGRGSYGCLFLGQCLDTNEYVAVKILNKQDLDTPQLELQQLEIDIQQSLDHPHLLGLIHVTQEPHFIYMVMELCDQGDLFEQVVQNPYDVDCVTLFVQIMEAIEYLHQNNIYHRDIKLENILMQSRDVVKVADFGLATRQRYSMDFGCGSTTYLGPEHFGEEQEEEEEEEEECLPYDCAASDIWSLGILLLALLFGRNPWQEPTEMDISFIEFKNDPSFTLKELFPSLGAKCIQFLEKVLAIDPKKRPTITQMKTEFCLLMEENEIYAEAQQGKTNKASYDSAIFSSQEEEEEEYENEKEEDDEGFEHVHFDQEEHELFIHDGEKESWWL